MFLLQDHLAANGCLVIGFLDKASLLDEWSFCIVQNKTRPKVYRFGLKDKQKEEKKNKEIKKKRRKRKKKKKKEEKEKKRKKRKKRKKKKKEEKEKKRKKIKIEYKKKR